MIEELPLLTPSEARRDRSRVRCHKKMKIQVGRRGQRRFRVERACLLGFGAIYLSSVAITVMRVLAR